jgi:hypothetical protein
VARSCERATAVPRMNTKGRRAESYLFKKSSSKLGTRVDEEMREAARGSMRFAKTGARMIRIGTAILLTVLASAAPGQTPPASPSDAETPKAPPIVGGLDLSAIDPSADACTDFYQYACGKTVNVTDPDYLKAVDELISSLPIDSWRSYLRWQILSGWAVALPKGKLAAIRNRIGHPERWPDYSALKVDRHDFIADLHRSAVFERDYQGPAFGEAYRDYFSLSNT